MSIKKVRRGDSILDNLTAEAFNSFIDAANGGDGGPPAALDGEWRDPYGVRVKVRNDTGGNLDRFSVVGLGAPVFSAANTSGTSLQNFKNKLLFAGATPVVATHWNKPAVLLQSVKNGRIGEAIVSGVVPVQIDVQNTSHLWADVKAGSTASLKSYATGSCRILSAISQTGVQWCLVQMGIPFKGPLLAKTVANPADTPTYPEQGTGSTKAFPIVFQRGGFLEEATNQSAHFSGQSEDPTNYVFSLTHNYIPVDTVIEVWEDVDTDADTHPGKFWTVFRDPIRLGVTKTGIDNMANGTVDEYDSNDYREETEVIREWRCRNWCGYDLEANTRVFFSQRKGVAYIINAECSASGSGSI